MTCPFDITTATNSVRLDAKRQGEATFTVYNRSGHAVRGRGQLVSKAPNIMPWLKLAGSNERNFAIAGAEQYIVQIDVPAEAPAGSYVFQLDMVGVKNPEEEYCAGPSVTFEVPPPVPPKRISKKLVAGLIAAAIVIGASTYLLWPRPIEVPMLLGMAVNDAQATLEAHRLTPGELIEGDGGEVEPGRVFATTPGPGTPVSFNAPVNLMVAAAPTPTPTPPPTATPAPTPTPDLAATATVEAQAAAAATDVAITAAIGKYRGTWRLTGSGYPYITQLYVSRDGQNLTIAVAGTAFLALGDNGLESHVCRGGCTWGSVTQSYTDDPIRVTINAQTGLSHELTLTAIDASTLSVFYRASAGNQSSPEMVASFERVHTRPGVITDMLPQVAIDENSPVRAERIISGVIETPIPAATLMAPDFDLQRLQP